MRVKATQGDSTALDTIAKNLDVLMDNEPDFAAEVKAIAHEINIGWWGDKTLLIPYQTSILACQVS